MACSCKGKVVLPSSQLVLPEFLFKFQLPNKSTDAMFKPGPEKPPNRYDIQNPNLVYDIFLSSGSGTAESIIAYTSCLHASLQKAGFSVFLDYGHSIFSSPLQAMQRARVSVVALSTGYAGSPRDLELLELMLECRRNSGQFILPVFLGVTPRDMRKAFADFTKSVSEKDKVECWKVALERICQIQSYQWVYLNNYKWSDNDMHIKNVVGYVGGLLDTRKLFVAEFEVEVGYRMQDATKLLVHSKSKEVLLLGIWGMVGIGKTTIAKAIYNENCGKFEGRSFLANIREVWEQNTSHVYLQERILLDILNLPKIRIDNIEIGKKMLKKRLSNKKVLLVLDDVNKKEQLNALCGSSEWFGPGSIIIITTRDRSLLQDHRVDHVYRMKEMNENKSLELFNRYAFKKASNTQYLDELSKNVVAYAGGLPLALEVLGSNLLGSLESIPDGLIDSPHPVLQKVLKKCVEDLNDTEKAIFLDIACFLIGMDQEEVIQALNAFGDLAKDGIKALEDRCFIRFDDMNKLRMHVLLRDMGREVICEQKGGDPASWIYDVFLSFRGEETRATFTSHIYTSLANAGIYVFRDDDEIRRGDRISISLLQAIRASRISVVVLSRHYANSRWCLQELENIMECRRAIGQVVVPVFYGVDPSNVRNQTGLFGEAFQDLLKRFSVDRDKEKRWRKALHQIGSIAGMVIIDSRNESEDVSLIVEDISALLDDTLLFVAQHPVGVKSRVQHVIKLLNHQYAKDVQLFGILGIGGIGKTTIAKAIYNQIHRDFEGSSFLENIREFWELITARVNLQEHLLSDIYKTTKIRIHSIEFGKTILQQKLRHRRVLVILDDVDELDQLKALCWSREWFGPGSRIIITTRDESLLRVLNVDHISRMSEMDNDESVEHFCWNAFKQSSPKEDFAELSIDVVAYCGGLPLALEVIGSVLFDKNVKEWESLLEKLKKIPNDKVQKKLRISFDSLNDDTVKEIFLDIAFFFIGMDRNDVVHILDEYDAEIGISVLVDRNLVTVDSNNRLGMHALLRDMGREIVREKSPKELERRSRLWLQKEVFEVLQTHTGTKAIEGVTLKLPRSNAFCLETKAFNKMKRLRLLQLASVQLDGDFEHMSKNIRWICWHGFPYKYIPSKFYQASLVAMELESSSLRFMWKKTQFLGMLKVLNLSHSYHLTQTPDFSYLPNLEKLLLKGCSSLSMISDTIGHLRKILLIDLEDCTSLLNLPRSFYELNSLITLVISGCSLIDILEEDLAQMKSLKKLIADKTGITQVPFSIVRSKSIGYISLCGYEGFTRDVFPSLIWSWMSPTNNLSSLVQSFAGSGIVSSDVLNLRSFWVECGTDLQLSGGVAKILDTLYATYYKELEVTPTTSQASQISSSSLIGFHSQFHTFGSPKSLLIEVGKKTTVSIILREIILQKLITVEFHDYLLPSDNYPYWLTFTSEGSSIIFEVPHVHSRELKTIMLCIMYPSSPYTITFESLKNVLIINYTKSTIQVYKQDTLASFEDEEWQNIISSMEPGDRVEVHIVLFGYGFSVKKTTIFLIYDGPIHQKMEHQYADVIVSCDNDTISGFGDVTSNENVCVSDDDIVALVKNEKTFPIVVPSASLNSQEESGNLGYKNTTQNQEYQQLQESPFVPKTDDAEPDRVEETNESELLVDLPEDVDLLAELDKILSESYISKFKSQSLSVIHILHKIQQLFDNQLEVLVVDGGIRRQFLDLLAQLKQMKSQVPTNLKPLVNDIKKFYEDVLNYFPSIQEVFGNHQRLIESKNRLQDKLETAKSRQAHFYASISKGKERINEMSKEINDLELKLKALYVKKDKLESTVKLCEVETLNINMKAATWVTEREEVERTLQDSESAFRNAESSKQNYERKLTELKSALGNIKH
ncbi:hypothetical protein HN51_022723 [Arachis hypogaea]|uniref:disease resistance protein RPP2A isoform X1 n=2 Tax=Arachis hypogaea TaxID=3818 RepID=UPI000DED0C04|nr:uncharacterized protein LOC112749677 isoform X1 [Arachis hypogaea]QHO54041.1 TMV resistance protein N [Arachis hypogaea]